MKKLISLILALLLAAAMLAACAPSNMDGTEANLQTAPPEASTQDTEVTEPTDSTEETTEPVDASDPTEPEQETTEGTEVTEPETNKPTQPPTTEPPHTHSYTSTKVAATCTNKGYTLHKCSCGKSYTDNETAALGHSWGDWTVVTQPTTQQEGSESRSCWRCGAVESRAIPKLEPPALEWSDLDLNRAMAVGNQYAASKYGCIPDNSLGFDGGFDMPINLSKGEIILAAERTGRTFQQVIEAEMMGNVDLFAECRRLYGYDSIENWHIKCWCEIKDNQLWFYVFY